MVIYKLLSSTFTEYVVEKDVEIAINLGNLKQIMRRIEAIKKFKKKSRYIKAIVFKTITN